MTPAQTAAKPLRKPQGPPDDRAVKMVRNLSFSMLASFVKKLKATDADVADYIAKRLAE